MQARGRFRTRGRVSLNRSKVRVTPGDGKERTMQSEQGLSLCRLSQVHLYNVHDCLVLFLLSGQSNDISASQDGQYPGRRSTRKSGQDNGGQ